ncbi:MAG: GAF domain-containing protein [Calditrichaeota bacterium]|nr:MAG: GAF domain-containing protein [Calditrichota bacterium]
MITQDIRNTTVYDQLQEDPNELLAYYRRLFNYKYVLVLPLIEARTLQPVFSFPEKEWLPFYRAREVEWLNFYPKALFRGALDDQPHAKELFNHFEIDHLYPIRFGNTTYGFLALGAHGRPPNEFEKQTARLIVRYLASQWNARRLMNEIQRSSQKTERLLQEISTVLEVTRAMESGGDIQHLLETIMEKAMDVMAVEAVSLMLMTEQGDLEFRVALGPRGKQVKRFKIKPGQGIAGTVAQNGKPLLIADAYNDPRFDHSFDKRSGFRTRSILCVPMSHRGRLIGVVQALNRFDGKPFNEHDLKTFTIYAGQAAVAIENSRLLYKALENEKIKSQIAVASEIQRLIVPEKLPYIPHLELAGRYIPCQGVGGDFYTVVPLNEHETVVAIADVSGKSVPGALLVSTLHAMLKAYLDFTADLALIMRKLNRKIIDLSTTDRFITIFLAKINTRIGQIEYISAGHNPQFLLRRPFKVSPLSSTGMAIGIIDYDYHSQRHSFQPGDVLLLYTDGVVEARNADGREYGEDNLIQLMHTPGMENVSALSERIVRAVHEHCHPQKPHDDVTLLALRYKETDNG